VEDGIVRTISEAFQRFLGYDKPAYVPKLSFEPKEALELINSSGGIPVIAHPMYVYYKNENIINELVPLGLKGIEVWHSRHSNSAVKTFSDLAFEMGLVSTGGSDCHGRFEDDPAVMGKIKVPYSAVEALKKLKQKINA